MQTCPECKAEQSGRAPFCENCGYRLRRQETGREPLEAARLHPRPHARDGTPGSAGLPATVRDIEVSEAALAEMTRARPLEPRHEESRTVVEGLPVVASREDLPVEPSVDDQVAGLLYAAPAPEAETAHEPRPPRASVPRTGRMTGIAGPERPPGAQRPEDRRSERSGIYSGPSVFGRYRWILLGLTSFAVAAISVLVTYFVMSSLPPEAAKVAASALEPSRRVLVEEGPFRQGLGEEVRSFILQSCQKFEDDPSEKCAEARLLKGEFPQRTLKLGSYAVDSKEVTGAQYHLCVQKGACADVNYRDCEVRTPQGLQVALRVPKPLQAPEQPVVCVSRDEAQAFCQWAGGYLPSHEQWEKAARGEDAGLFPWGDLWAADRANWGEMDIARTLVVGRLDGEEWTAIPGSYDSGKSPLGLYDMAGNVAEWVFGDDPLKGETRGGSWVSNPFELRTTARVDLDARARRTDVGFRCAYKGL